MTIEDIYKKVVKLGMDLDPRGTNNVKEYLKKEKKEFNELGKRKKKSFDSERLSNPFADTRVLYGDGKKKIKNILVGIDIEVGEILLADRLREKGVNIDLVIAHHPEGRAMANFYDVMGMQADILHKFGVPVQVAEAMLEPRIEEVSRRMMPVNYNRTVDAAILLDVPLMCVHTPADNAVAGHLQKLFDRKKPRYVGDVLDILLDIPEYRISSLEQNIPRVLVGNEKRRCGNIFVDMTGGTGGSKEMFQRLANTDVGTVVGMHIGEDHRKEAEKNYINVVIAGHMSSDSLGINLILDNLLKDNPSLVIHTCSGLKRFSRLKKVN